MGCKTRKEKVNFQIVQLGCLECTHIAASLDQSQELQLKCKLHKFKVYKRSKCNDLNIFNG